MQLSSLLYGGLLILQILTMNMLFTDYAADYNKAFEENRLAIAVNYAVDAATQEMKDNSANLGQDYESISRINVDPIVAMDTFSTILLKNYDIPLSSTNQQSVLLDYCPVFMVATYDGYYIASKQKINDAGVENMIFSPKLPYYDIYMETDGTKSLYSFNLSLTSAIKIDESGGVYKVGTPPLSKKEQSDVINTRISDVLNEYLVKYANRDPRGRIFIPSEMTTLHSTNPIRNTTVFAYIDNFDLAGYGTNLQSFGIGGSEIKQKKVVVGFSTVTNGKTELYYAYSDRVPTGVVPIETFDSQEDAAKEGYYFYIE